MVSKRLILLSRQMRTRGHWGRQGSCLGRPQAAVLACSAAAKELQVQFPVTVLTVRVFSPSAAGITQCDSTNQTNKMMAVNRLCHDFLFLCRARPYNTIRQQGKAGWDLG